MVEVAVKEIKEAGIISGAEYKVELDGAAVTILSGKVGLYNISKHLKKIIEKECHR